MQTISFLNFNSWILSSVHCSRECIENKAINKCSKLYFLTQIQAYLAIESYKFTPLEAYDKSAFMKIIFCDPAIFVNYFSKSILLISFTLHLFFSRPNTKAKLRSTWKSLNLQMQSLLLVAMEPFQRSVIIHMIFRVFSMFWWGLYNNWLCWKGIWSQSQDLINFFISFTSCFSQL